MTANKMGTTNKTMKTNMGIIDRTIRVLVASIITILFFANIISGALAIILLAFAAVFVLTSFVGFCPLYAPFGISTKGNSINNKQAALALISGGAQVIDVRTQSEFASGHLSGSVNIPLDKLANQLERINKSKPVVVCCASGVRSHTASEMLRSKGFNAINGGAWTALR